MLTANRRALKQFLPESPTIEVGTLPRQTIDLPCGRVAYLRHGKGAPLLLVHGIPTSCRLWEPLLGILGERYDCIVPDLLGLGHSVPKPDADLASPGQADMLAQLLDALGIGTTHAVFHDQGGAHGGQFLKRHGERIRAHVFTDVVCYDNWYVPVIAAAVTVAKLGLVPLLAKLRIIEALFDLHTLPRTIVRGRFPKAMREDWYRALRAGGQAQADWIRYVVSQSPRWTLDAVPTLKAWTKPTRILWAAEDCFLPPSWGVKLAEDMPGAAGVVKLLPFASHFWQAEVPQSGARAIREFFDGLGT